MAETEDGRLVAVKRKTVKKARDPGDPNALWMMILGKCANSGRTYGQACGWFKNQHGCWPDAAGVSPLASFGQNKMQVSALWPGFNRRKRA
jgi:hypothetical protein